MGSLCGDDHVVHSFFAPTSGFRWTSESPTGTIPAGSRKRRSPRAGAVLSVSRSSSGTTVSGVRSGFREGVGCNPYPFGFGGMWSVIACPGGKLRCAGNGRFEEGERRAIGLSRDGRLLPLRRHCEGRWLPAILPTRCGGFPETNRPVLRCQRPGRDSRFPTAGRTAPGLPNGRPPGRGTLRRNRPAPRPGECPKRPPTRTATGPASCPETPHHRANYQRRLGFPLKGGDRSVSPSGPGECRVQCQENPMGARAGTASRGSCGAGGF